MNNISKYDIHFKYFGHILFHSILQRVYLERKTLRVIYSDQTPVITKYTFEIVWLNIRIVN